MIHGMVDRPLIFTMEDSEASPFGDPPSFHRVRGEPFEGPSRQTVQETHGMTSCAEWTGVLLSVLLEQAGVQDGGTWIVAEGVEEVKGSVEPSDGEGDGRHVWCAYAMNGEAIRPQQGLSAAVGGSRLRRNPFRTKWLRRVKVVDQLLHDLQRLRASSSGPRRRCAGLPGRIEIGHHVSVRGTTAARPRILRDQRPGLVRWGCRWQGGSLHRRWPTAGWTPRFGGRHIAWRIPGSASSGIGTETETELQSRCTDELGQVQPSRAQVAEFFNVPLVPSYRIPGLDNSAFSRGGSQAMGAFTMRFLRVLRSPAVSDAAGGLRAGAVAHLWCGTDPDRRGNPCLGYLHQSHGSGAPAGARNRPTKARWCIGGRGCAGCHGRDREQMVRAPRLVKRRRGARCRPLGLGANIADPRAVRDGGLGLHQSRHASQSEKASLPPMRSTR